MRDLVPLPRFVLSLALILAALPCAASAQAADGENKPDIESLLPLENRPENFHGAVGYYQKVTATAKPEQVQVEEPLLLTVRISARQAGVASAIAAGPA